jgi:hypothetical protein
MDDLDGPFKICNNGSFPHDTFLGCQWIGYGRIIILSYSYSL